jgi:hypothetical protein
MAKKDKRPIDQGILNKSINYLTTSNNFTLISANATKLI